MKPQARIVAREVALDSLAPIGVAAGHPKKPVFFEKTGF